MRGSFDFFSIGFDVDVELIQNALARQARIYLGKVCSLSDEPSLHFHHSDDEKGIYGLPLE